MPTLIRLIDAAFVAASDDFTLVADDEAAPDGSIILGFERFRAEGPAYLDGGRRLGVRVSPDQRIEDLAYDLPRLALIALEFPKFRDGRAYSSAALLRERFAFKGEIRAVGDVLREQAFEMVRCGFDAFEAADDASAQSWSQAAHSFRHVYQAAADGREPAFVERRR